MFVIKTKIDKIFHNYKMNLTKIEESKNSKFAYSGKNFHKFHLFHLFKHLPF